MTDDGMIALDRNELAVKNPHNKSVNVNNNKNKKKQTNKQTISLKR
jgi:hypothetical protein